MRSYYEFIDFEKEAAARWKKEFGNLSDTAKNTLRKSVAKSPKEIVKGIEKGNTALINRLGTDVVSHKNGRKIKKFFTQRGNTKNDARQIADIVKKKVETGAVGTLDGKEQIITGFRRSLFNKDKAKLTGRKTKKIFYAKDPDLGRLSRSDKRAVSAIALRHELDEARSFRNNGPISGYGSHNAPDVIHRESANIALMPDKVKNTFSRARKEHAISLTKKELKEYKRHPFHVGIPYTGAETTNLAKRGIKYGDSPYFNKKLSNKHVQDVRQGKETIHASWDFRPANFARNSKLK